MRGDCLEHNERLARHMERTWPNRFSEFCSSLRRYPLPVTSSAAATVLRGSSTAALQAVDAYCCGLRRRCHPECGHGDAEEDLLFPPPPSVHGPDDRTAAMPSPFRSFKRRCMERSAGRNPGAEGSAEEDVLLTLLDSSFSPHLGCRVGCPSPPAAGRPTDAQPAEERLSVAELRSRCATRGLLTTGTKKVLLARLRQHDESQQSGLLSQCERGGEAQPQLRSTMISSGGVLLRQLAPTRGEQLAHSQRLRTPFRSPSARSQTSPPATDEPQVWRLVGTPQEFVTALMHKRRRENRTDGTLAQHSSDEREIGQGKWRVLVDNRERIHGAHNRVIEAFTTAGVPTASCTLPCGDFMIGINISDEIHGEREVFLNAEENSNLSPPHSPTVVGGESVDVPVQKLFSVVVERKTVKDLSASIATPRYYEQRRLLSISPFRSVVWVVEGTTEMLRPDEQRRVSSACASLAAIPRFRVIRTRNIKETISWLHSLAIAYTTTYEKSRPSNARSPLQTPPPPPPLADYVTCINLIAKIKQELRSTTTFPRMLMCVRGCSSALATQLACKYGSLLHLWSRLRNCGREACDADVDIRRLSKTQKDVYVRLTEFLLAEEYC